MGKPTEAQASILLEWIERGHCKDHMAADAIRAVARDWFRLSLLVDSHVRDLAVFISKAEK